MKASEPACAIHQKPGTGQISPTALDRLMDRVSRLIYPSNELTAACVAIIHYKARSVLRDLVER